MQNGRVYFLTSPSNKIVTCDIELDQGWYNNMNVPFGSMGFGAPQEIKKVITGYGKKMK